MNDLIVQFAILWGEKMAGPCSSKEKEIVEEMKRYDSEELLSIFSAWAEEYNKTDAIDTIDFFEEKLTDLIHE